MLAFDRAERLAAFLDAPRPYAALSGRSLAAMLAGRGLGIALNPDVAPSASLVAAEAVDWLAGAGGGALAAQQARLVALRPPLYAAPALVAVLANRIGAYGGRDTAGYLATAVFEAGSDGLVLALEGVPEAGQAAVAAAIDEAVRFSGVEAVRLDVVFPAATMLERMARAGLAFRPAAASDGDPGPPPRLR